jgi:hypothetical protein
MIMFSALGCMDQPCGFCRWHSPGGGHAQISSWPGPTRHRQPAAHLPQGDTQSRLASRPGEPDDAWRRVKPFRFIDAPVIRYLSHEEITRLLKACQGDAFCDLVHAALLTGCRYGELCRLKVAGDVETLMIPDAKSGRVRHVTLTGEAPEPDVRRDGVPIGTECNFLTTKLGSIPERGERS